MSLIIRPQQTAHIIIHYQPIHFTSGLLSRLFSSCSRERYAISKNIQALATLTRQSGIENIWALFDNGKTRHPARIYQDFNLASEHVIKHDYYDPFRAQGRDTELQSHLEDGGKNTLILSGAYAQQCILLAAESARKKGYDVIVPRETVLNGRARAGFPTEWVYREIANLGGHVLTLAEVISALQPRLSPKP